MGVIMRTAIVLLGICLIVLLTSQPASAQIVWTEQTIADFSGALWVFAADVDGDGDTDVLGAAENANDITWWENLDGTGLNWSQHIISSAFAGAACVYAEDMDGDGDIDVLGASPSANYISWWENMDGTGLIWFERIVSISYFGAVSVHAEDVDGDGDMDVLGAVSTLDEIIWWENLDGAGLDWSQHIVGMAGEFSDANSVHAEDMDGDGDVDVLASGGFDNIFWWENLDGTGLNWSQHAVDGWYSSVNCVYAEDMDGDGDMDVLGSAHLADDITWWENVDGSGLSWTDHNVDDMFYFAWNVYAEDVDGDGSMDVLGAAYDAHEITWWDNMGGTGLNWFEHTVDGEFNGATCVYAADVNGDGDMDILGSSYSANDITVWLQDGSPEPAVIITLTPAAVPTIVAQGSFFEYNTTIISNIQQPQLVDIWTLALTPSGNVVGPIWTLNNFPILPGGSITAEGIWQEVPVYAPTGLYTFGMRAGDYPGVVVAEDSFDFEVIAAAGASVLANSWNGGDYEALAELAELAESGTLLDAKLMPQEFSISAAYPNPFNPTTSLSVSLPDAAELNVQVFNIAGQQVAELANGSFNAGTHRFTFDASGMASGLYFIRATIPEQLDQTQKVLLVR
jgi:FG-GAP-like repeat/Secretion system C-terminal sorting domain